MKLNEGRIGRQETAAMLGMAVYVGAVFTLDSQRAYGGGNSTYIWVPLSIGLAMGAALLIMAAMERAGISTLDELFTAAFGKAAGRAAALTIMGIIVLNAYLIAVDFVNMIHSFAFFESSYWAIVVWVLGVMFVLSMWGLECISRTSLILGPFVGAVIVAALIGPRDGYSLYRLYPMPGNTPAEVAMLALEGSVQPFGAMAGLLAITPGVHGLKFGRRACATGSLIALGLAFLTQLAIGLTYGYMDLSDIFFPMYRIDMMQVKEGYFFRMDTLLLFVWLMAAMVAGAYHIYTASVLWCRCFGPKDTRPGVAALTVVLGCAVLLQARGYYDQFTALYQWQGKWGWLALLPPLSASAIVLIKGRAGKGARA